MMVSVRRLGVAAAILALWSAAPAAGQENLDKGKTPAELYASDCAICHKSPRGLAAAGGILGVQSFLREHYTASRESAAAISAYLQAIGRTAPPPQRARTTKHTAKPGEAKTGNSSKDKTDGKTDGKSEAKGAEPKPPQAKPAAAEPGAAAPAEAVAKPAEPKPADAKAEAPKASPGKTETDAKPAAEKKSD